MTDRQPENENSAAATGFVHAEGNKVIGTDGKPLIIKGIALGNSVWGNPQTPNMKHHTEETYKELSEMGFNSVRFYINYGLFENDSNPYRYKESGFEWIDKNIQWAKKYDMGIILNMHFPQGGYQSGGNGTALWTDKSCQDRLTALWKAIAERYANEPTIWGYGFINEPFIPFTGDYDETAQQLFDLMERMTKEIRSVSPHQAVFVEKLCNVKFPENANIDWSWFTVENTFGIVPDDNVIYEFHFYDPITFTHQNTDWTGMGGIYKTYPSDELASAEYENGWVGCVRAEAKSEQGEWTYFETRPQVRTAEYNAACATINAPRINDGTVYFDDITVTEIAPDGSKRTVFAYDFTSNSTSIFSSWSADGTGELFYSLNGRSGGCLAVTGSAGDFTASAERFEMKEGHKYIVSGYVRKENTSSSSTVRIDFAKVKEGTIRTVSKEYLESNVKKYVDFAAENNVPLYLGEFGVYITGFEENRGGLQWVSDMIDICYKYNIGFNYHTYHENGFGLYRSSDNVLPNEKDLNKELAELFKEKLS